MIDFDGVLDQVSRGSGDYLRNVAGGTIMVMGLLDVVAAGNHTFLIISGGGGGRRAAILQTAANLRSAAEALDADADSFITHGVPPFSTTQAQHVAASIDYSAAMGSGYVDGTLLSAAAYTLMTAGNTSDTASTQLIAGSVLDGKIGEARFYSFAMSQDQIRSIAVLRGSDGMWGSCGMRCPMSEGAPGAAVPAGSVVMDWTNNNRDLARTDAPVYSEYFTRRRRKVS